MDRRQFLTTLSVLGGAVPLGLPREAHGGENDPSSLLDAARKITDPNVLNAIAVLAAPPPSAITVRYLEISGWDGHERDKLVVNGPPRYYKGMTSAATAALAALVQAMNKGGWHTAANEAVARRVYSGRGSPEDIRLVLRWVDWERGNLPTGSRAEPDKATIYRGNRKPDASLPDRIDALQKHFNDHIRLDCNGFAGNYYKIVPHVAPRYHNIPLEETAPLNYLTSQSGRGARTLKALADLQTGDAVVYLGVSHIAVIEQVRPAESHKEALDTYDALVGYDPLVPKGKDTVKATLAKEAGRPCAVILTVESCNDGIYNGMVMRASIITAADSAQPEAPPSNQSTCFNPDFRSKNPGATDPGQQTIPCADWVKHPRRSWFPAFRIHNNVTSSDGRGRLVSVVRM